MSVESRLTDVEEALRLLRDADRLQGRRFSAAAPSDGALARWNATTKKWEPALDEIITSRMLAPLVLEQRATADTTFTADVTEGDLTGATVTFTPDIASMAVVWGYFDVDVTTAGGGFIGILDVDGSNEGAQAIYNPTDDDRCLLSQVWVFPLTAASHTVKLQGRQIAASGATIAKATHTKLVVWLIGDANVTDDTSS